MPAGTSHTYRAALGTIWSLMLKGNASVPLESWYYLFRSQQVAEKKDITDSSLIGPQICAANIDLGAISSLPVWLQHCTGSDSPNP